jgi:hypothetical protein
MPDTEEVTGSNSVQPTSGPICVPGPLRRRGMAALSRQHESCSQVARRSGLAGYPRRARNAAVFTRFWQDVEQNRRVALREIST